VFRYHLVLQYFIDNRLAVSPVDRRPPIATTLTGCHVNSNNLRSVRDDEISYGDENVAQSNAQRHRIAVSARSTPDVVAWYSSTSPAAAGALSRREADVEEPDAGVELSLDVDTLTPRPADGHRTVIQSAVGLVGARLVRARQTYVAQRALALTTHPVWTRCESTLIVEQLTSKVVRFLS
jgi:hypothetical protein